MKTYIASGRGGFLRKLSRRHGPLAAVKYSRRLGLSVPQVEVLAKRKVIGTYSRGSRVR